MKYISLDIETTALSPEEGLILEIGGDVDDLESPQPLEELPKFHCYITYENLIGGFKTFQFHQSNGFLEKYFSSEHVYIHEARKSLVRFVRENFGDSKVTFAGKNFASFDRPWLTQNGFALNAHHRTIDIGFHFMKPEDKYLPSLQDCLKRAGIESEVTHNALEDALQIVKLVRAAKLEI